MTISLSLDPDGYPTEECLTSIEKAHIENKDDALNLLREIKRIWAYEAWGWSEIVASDGKKEKIVFKISTGGWSGNEDLISSLHKNFIFWSIAWESSRRGGHYTFEFPIS